MKKLWNIEENNRPNELKEKMRMILNMPLRYKEMCGRLGEEYIAGGCKKEAQIAKWMQYAEIVITTHPTRMTVKQVYDCPIILPDDRSRFIKYMESLIISYMAEKNTHELVTTKMNILESLGMVNSNFTFARKYMNRSKPERHGGIEKENIGVEEMRKCCVVAAQAVLLPWLESSIKSMRRKSIITCADAYMLITENELGIRENRTVLAVNDSSAADYDLAGKIQQAYADTYAELENRYPMLKRYSNEYMFSWLKAIEENMVVQRLLSEIPNLRHIYKCIVLHSEKSIVDRCYPEAKKIINDESKRKLRDTVAFERNDIPKITVSRLISECIELNPDIDYQNDMAIKKD